jgi:hypothetical protein
MIDGHAAIVESVRLKNRCLILQFIAAEDNNFSSEVSEYGGNG